MSAQDPEHPDDVEPEAGDGVDAEVPAWTPSWARREPRYGDFALGTGVVVSVAALALWLMGRRLWCACGSANPFSFEVMSQHNSQHLIDPYTFTHVLHGPLYYLLLWLTLRRWASPLLRFFLAIGLEAIWEVIENTDWVINAYREATISLDYFGDSITNSMADIAACALGFVLARRLPLKYTLGGFVAIELILLVWIRDSLTLNILMLLFPIEAVKTWQMGG